MVGDGFDIIGGDGGVRLANRIGVLELNTSLHDATVEYLRGVLPWTASTQFTSLNRAFKRLESEQKMPVWLAVYRGDSGYDSQSKRAGWARDEQLLPKTRAVVRPAAEADDEQPPIIAAYCRFSPLDFPYREEGAFELATDAGDVCKPVELPDLDVGSVDELDGALRWLAVLHRMHRGGLLRGGETELLMSLNPPTNADPLAYLVGVGSDGESYNERCRTVRRRGFVWKVKDFVRMSDDATAILARLAEEKPTAIRQNELSLVGLLDEVLIAIDEGQSFEEMYPLLRQVEPLRLKEFGDDGRWPGCLVRFKDGYYQLYTKHPHLDEHHQADWATLSSDDDKELRQHVKRVIRAWLRQLEPDEKRLTRLGDEPANQAAEAESHQEPATTADASHDASHDANSIEDWERETPRLDTQSVEWVAARQENQKKLGLPIETMRNYRAASKGGRKTPGNMFGIDRDGRRWRRQGTPGSTVYYYVPSLPKSVE